jgi:hypothetical protein
MGVIVSQKQLNCNLIKVQVYLLIAHLLNSNVPETSFHGKFKASV